MAASPKWKVYTTDDNYVASCKEVEAALVLADWYGQGATVRNDHAKRSVMFTIGVDSPSPSESIDGAVLVVERNCGQLSCVGCGKARALNADRKCVPCVWGTATPRISRPRSPGGS